MTQDPSHRHAQDAPKHPGLASPAPLQLRRAGRPESPQPRSPRRAGKWAIPAGDRVIPGSPPPAAQRSPGRHDSPGPIPPTFHPYSGAGSYHVHEDSPGNTGVSCLALLQGIFPTRGSNLGLLQCRQILYHLSHQGSPRMLEWVAYLFSRGSSRSRN